jgi:hypothetical protein
MRPPGQSNAWAVDRIGKASSVYIGAAVVTPMLCSVKLSGRRFLVGERGELRSIGLAESGFVTQHRVEMRDVGVEESEGRG